MHRFTLTVAPCNITLLWLIQLLLLRIKMFLVFEFGVVFVLACVFIILLDLMCSAFDQLNKPELVKGGCTCQEDHKEMIF